MVTAFCVWKRTDDSTILPIHAAGTGGLFAFRYFPKIRAFGEFAHLATPQTVTPPIVPLPQYDSVTPSRI